MFLNGIFSSISKYRILQRIRYLQRSFGEVEMKYHMLIKKEHILLFLITMKSSQYYVYIMFPYFRVFISHEWVDPGVKQT